MNAPPTRFEELSSADFESRNYLSQFAVRINHHRTEPDEPGETTIILESPAGMHLFPVTDEDLEKLTELIGSFRAGIREAEGL